MKNRNLMVLVSLVLVLSIAAAFYFLGVDPYLKQKKVVDTAEFELKTKQLELLTLQTENLKLKPLQRQSLPAEPDTAKREYELLLMKMLKDAGARIFFVNYNDAFSKDPRNIPAIDPENKKSALTYRRIVCVIKMERTDLTTITEFLRLYYSVPLLQQITKLELKRTTLDLSEDKRPLKERADINVTINTEAIIVDGAPARRSVIPIPPSNGAVMGSMTWAMMEQSSKIGQTITPMPIEQMLSTGNRDYTLLAAKDLFHGKLPEIPAEIVKATEKEADVVIPPKPDFRQYIKFGSLITSYEGVDQTTELSIFDLVNHEDYELTLTQVGEKLKVVMKKYYYADGKKKLYDRGEKLEIGNASMSNKNTFLIHGLDGDSLILSERAAGLKAASRDDRPASRPGSKTKVVLPTPEPIGVLLGGLFVTAPKPEKFYRWEYGKSLKDIIELSKTEAEKAIQRASSRMLTSRDVQKDAADPLAKEASKD